jgi:hypothetical protein
LGLRKKERAGGMTQAIKHLPNKQRALSSNPSTAQKRKETTRNEKKKLAI